PSTSGPGRRHLLPPRRYTPFDRDTPKLEMEAIIAGDYKFEPEEYWANVSDTARDFVRACLTIDPERRPTAAECLDHKWLASNTPHFVSTPSGGPTDLLPHVKKAFNAKLTWKKAAFSIKALHRMTALGGDTARQGGGGAAGERAAVQGGERAGGYGGRLDHAPPQPAPPQRQQRWGEQHLGQAGEDEPRGV
ncbi:hypothetical protein B0H14DRAFT_2970103, partial [Mycena olivaceomarginata]